MGGQIHSGRIWRFGGAPLLSPEVPKYEFLEGFGTSGWKIGVPQKRQIQPRPICGPLMKLFCGDSVVDKRVVSKRLFLADVPPERKPERGYTRMFPRNENRNEGTFACSPGTKTGTRIRSPKPPFTKPPFYLPMNY